jgi:hypothetical protein
VEGSIDLLIETGEAIIKVKKNIDRGFGIFALMDIWENWETLLPAYRDLFNVCAIHFASLTLTALYV